MATFKIGDRALYAGAWGLHPPRQCRITGIGENKGRLVYDNNLGHWGYAEQYTPVTEADALLSSKPAMYLGG